MTLKQALDEGVLLLESAKISDAKIDAWYLLSFITGISRADYFLRQNDAMDEESYAKYQEALRHRASHIPLQHITGEQDFMGLTFRVNEHVLIPRQDTETLVEQTLKEIPEGSRILDLCTGSGCVIISLVVLGKELTGVGVDISDEALAVARDNGARLAGDRVDFIHSDLFDSVTGKFDCIVSNPPYIPSKDIEELEPEVWVPRKFTCV